ncbi:MAG: Phosphate-selective porin [Pseudomonadota bacterium]|jgi:hypothetical protein
MRHVRSLLAFPLLASSWAWAGDADRQATEADDAKIEQVPWAIPNLQIQTWFTAWDQDEAAQADPGGYGDPELDTGFTLRRARLGLSGGYKGLHYSLRIGSSVPSDTLMPDPLPVDIIDAWARYRIESKGGVTRLSLGRQRVPFSREQQMSTNDLVFQETSTGTNWLTPNRDLGFMLQHDVKGFGVSAGVYNGNGDIFGNADNGVLTALRVEYSLGGDTYRTNAADSAFGVGLAGMYNHTVSTDVFGGVFDLLGRYKGLTLQAEAQMNLLQPVEKPTVLAPDVPANTLRLGGNAQISYYREVGIGAVEPAVRFSYFDSATHLQDNGDVADLHAGLSWREPIPFIDLGAGYIHRFELSGRDVENDSVRLWAGFRYPSRRFEPFDLAKAFKKLGGGDGAVKHEKKPHISKKPEAVSGGVHNPAALADGFVVPFQTWTLATQGEAGWTLPQACTFAGTIRIVDGILTRTEGAASESWTLSGGTLTDTGFRLRGQRPDGQAGEIAITWTTELDGQTLAKWTFDGKGPVGAFVADDRVGDQIPVVKSDCLAMP